jgi:hypothetical protein
MFRPCFLSAVALLLSLVAPGNAAAETTLRFQFPDGRKSKTTVTVTLHQVLTLNGRKHETRSEQELVISTENGIRDKDGELRQRLAVDSLKAKLTMPSGVVLEFDSSNSKAARTATPYDMFLDLLKANANANWSIVRDQENRVKSVDGRDKLLESLDQAKRELVKKQLDADFLRDRANQEMLRVPAHGESWELVELMRLDAGQNLTFKNQYTYQGEVDRGGRKLHQIDLVTKEAAYSIDSDAATPLKLVSSKLQPRQMEGVMFFDAGQGQIVECREMVQVTGDVAFRLSGNDLAGQLDLTLGTVSVVE